MISAAALCTTACDRGQAQMGPREAHLLGAAKIQKENYTPTGPATFAVSTDELYERQNFSGNKLTLLWGLVTLKDY
ncbi:MAG: hypothetical protein ACPG3X_00330 [Opitutales bacterium]